MSHNEHLNCQWQLARVPPAGWPQNDDFSWLSTEKVEPEKDQLLSRTLHLSMDPYQWGRRRTGVEVPGDVCHGRTVSQVIRSRTPGYEEGDYLFNTNGWQQFGLTGAGISNFSYMHPRKLDPTLAPISTALGVLGMLGLTAYAGMVLQCDPQPGETVVVSAASGGVGQVAGQLAKIRGARVVGIAGVQKKCEFVTNELGFDACVSHLSDDLQSDLAKVCPDGCDVYFESVGGHVFDAVLPFLNHASRITVCGFISQYGNTDGLNPRKSWQQTGQSRFDKQAVTVHDLFVGNFVDEYQAAFLAEMGDYIKDQLVFYREDQWSGLENAPAAFMAMLKGGNFGKTIVKVGAE